MPKHVASIYLTAGVLARAAVGRGELLEDAVRKLRTARHAALGDGTRGRYLGDGDVVVVLVDQGAGQAARERILEALGVNRA